MNKPLEGKRVLAVIHGTELFGSERANLEALQSMQRMGATILVGVSADSPGEGTLETSLETQVLRHFCCRLEATSLIPGCGMIAHTAIDNSSAFGPIPGHCTAQSSNSAPPT